MFKISFDKDSKKVQTFNNRATVVTITGEMKIPVAVWKVFPDDIATWMWEHQGIDVQWGNCTKDNEVFRIEVTGKSVCAEGDVFNTEIGQRIAESRAKLKLFLFMARLLKQLCEYYSRLLTGYVIIPTYTSPGALNTTMMKYNALAVKESHHLGKLLEEVQ